MTATIGRKNSRKRMRVIEESDAWVRVEGGCGNGYLDERAGLADVGVGVALKTNQLTC